MSDDFKHKELTGTILEGFYHVYNTLGYGFLEKVYENSLAVFLRRRDIEVLQQEPVSVYYEGEEVGEYFADLIVEWKVIVELKSAESLCAAHEAQLLNYLKATKTEVGLLLNFGRKPEHKRKVFSNDRKPFHHS